MSLNSDSAYRTEHLGLPLVNRSAFKCLLRRDATLAADAYQTPRAESRSCSAFEICEEWYRSAAEHKRFLDSGYVRFATLDRGPPLPFSPIRHPEISHCVHAVTRTWDPLRRATNPVSWYGELITRKVAESANDVGLLVNPQVTHEWLLPALGRMGTAFPAAALENPCWPFCDDSVADEELIGEFTSSSVAPLLLPLALGVRPNSCIHPTNVTSRKARSAKSTSSAAFPRALYVEPQRALGGLGRGRIRYPRPVLCHSSTFWVGWCLSIQIPSKSLSFAF